MLEFLSGILGPMLVPAIAAAFAAFKSVKFVHEGERGIRLRFGKATRNRKTDEVKVSPPGFIFMIPFADTLQRRHVRQQTIRLQNQTVVTTEGLVFSLSAFLLFRVTDVYKALFEIKGLEKALEDFIQSQLKVVACAKDSKGILDAKKISEEVRALIEAKANEWGVEFIEFGVIDVEPSEEAAQVLIMSARAKELVRIAEELNVDMTPGLAMVLVGAPLVASSPGSTTIISRPEPAT
ncbi:hypothetical protein HQ524_03650 [Candidatus Uhrbacteria bacterium]|nr:hypothetical protein [Candidatus Uhrbacteria bacterium]